MSFGEEILDFAGLVLGLLWDGLRSQFPSQAEKERRRLCELKKRKEREAKKRFENLYHAFKENRDMPPGEILTALFRIHNECVSLPQYPPRGFQREEDYWKDMYLYEMMNSVSRRSDKLEEGDGKRLFEMFFWPEIQDEYFSDTRWNILRAMEEFPMPETLPILGRYTEDAERSYHAHYRGSEYDVSLWSEIEQLKILMAKYEESANASSFFVSPDQIHRRLTMMTKRTTERRQMMPMT
jgi:hypothetical protein